MISVLLDFLFFALSFAAYSFISYVIAMMWFSNAHTRYLISFVGMGLSTCLWILFSAINLVTGDDYFVFVYSLHSIVVCFFPYVFFWYAMHFCKSRIVNSPIAAVLVIMIPLVDSILLATNPFHSLMFTGYENYPNLVMGPFFRYHAIIAYGALIFAFVRIFIYVFRSVRATPFMIAAAVSTVVPYLMNLIFALGVVRTKFDLTAICFSVTFTLFFLASHRSGMFTFKSISLSNVFTSLPDMILITNERGQIIESNESFKRIFPEFTINAGVTPMAEFFKWLSVYVKECHPENMLRDFGDAPFANDGSEFSILGDDGTVRTYTLHREVVMRGKIISAHIVTMADCTAYRSMISEIHDQNEDLIELKEIAEEASKTKGIFLANMSHELRTPINAITGMATIAKGTDDLDKIHNCLDKVDVASRQLLGIINDILDMSKIEANKMELSPEPFDLHVVLQNVRHIVDVRVSEKNQNFEVSIADDVPRAVMGDDLRVTQILLNLLSNAVKFTHNDGNISLTLKLLSEVDGVYHIEASITDDGIGITDDQKSRLFGSFEQADKGTAKQYGGTGLGLAITKSLTELMGGGIALESEPGKGSCFTVNFRLQTGSETMLTKSAEKKSYDFTGRNALLAEDVEINCEILLALLEPSFIQIDCAKNGKEAIERFNAAPDKYDIIFMDIQMPVMDGYTATNLIRTAPTETSAAIPILAMTANAFSEDIAKCRAIGMNDHIAKPIDIDLLLQKMNTLMNEYREA